MDLAWQNGNLLAATIRRVTIVSPGGGIQQTLEFGFDVSEGFGGITSSREGGFYLVGDTARRLFSRSVGWLGNDEGDAFVTKRNLDGSEVWSIQVGDLKDRGSNPPTIQVGDHIGLSPDGNELYVGVRTGLTYGTAEPQYSEVWKLDPGTGDFLSATAIPRPELRAMYVGTGGVYVVTRDDIRKVGGWTVISPSATTQFVGEFGGITESDGIIYAVVNSNQVIRISPGGSLLN